MIIAKLTTSLSRRSAISVAISGLIGLPRGAEAAREPLYDGAHPSVGPLGSTYGFRFGLKHNLPTSQVMGDVALVGLPNEFRALTIACAPPEMDDTPLAARWDAVLRHIIEQPAEGLAGLVAKARFLAVLEDQSDRESGAALGWSLARDLLRITGERA